MLGNIEALIAPDAPGTDESLRQRLLVASLCKSLLSSPAAPPAPDPNRSVVETLSPRVKQTLDGMICGDSEKQVARKLGVSPHTVHVYVKKLYHEFNVSSRGELLARFIKR